VSLTYCEPETVAEAVALLAESEDSKLLAGGQSLMVLIRHGLVAPSRLISLQRVAQLHDVGPKPDGSIWIGAMATYRQVAREVGTLLPGLADACIQVGPIPVQNVGTLGGSICHNAPGADVPPALLALDAEAVVRSQAGERAIPLAEFFLGYFETVLGPGDVLVAIRVPKPAAGAVSGYLKFNYRLIDMAMVGVAVAAVRDEAAWCHVRIAIGGTATVPYRVPSAERVLEGQPLTDQLIGGAGRVAAAEREPISDVHCSGAYRRRIIPVVFKRALERASAGKPG
jgi:carbon-monoxide dehydrogenase medium subunit